MPSSNPYCTPDCNAPECSSQPRSLRFIDSFKQDLLVADTSYQQQKQAEQRHLSLALLLVGGFAVLEWGLGWYSHSLSLLAEAWHLLADAATFLLALVGVWLAQRSRYGRLAEVAIAPLIGLALLVTGGSIAWEALDRWASPPEGILSAPMAIAAIAGLGVNAVNMAFLHGHSHDNLSIRGVVLHVLADALSAAAILLSAIAVAWWGWVWFDTVAGLAIAAIVMGSSVPLLWQSLRQAVDLPP